MIRSALFQKGGVTPKSLKRPGETLKRDKKYASRNDFIEDCILKYLQGKGELQSHDVCVEPTALQNSLDCEMGIIMSSKHTSALHFTLTSTSTA